MKIKTILVNITKPISNMPPDKNALRFFLKKRIKIYWTIVNHSVNNINKPHMKHFTTHRWLMHKMMICGQVVLGTFSQPSRTGPQVSQNHTIRAREDLDECNGPSQWRLRIFSEQHQQARFDLDWSSPFQPLLMCVVMVSTNHIVPQDLEHLLDELPAFKAVWS